MIFSVKNLSNIIILVWDICVSEKITNIITKKACNKNLLKADLIIFKSEKKPKIKTANENDIYR